MSSATAATRLHLQIYLLRSSMSASTGRIVPASLTSTILAPVSTSLTPHQWYIRKPAAATSNAKSAADQKQRVTLTTSQVWQQVQDIKKQPRASRSLLYRHLRTSIQTEANHRLHSVVADGQAWLDSGAEGSLKYRIKQGVESLLEKVDTQEEAMKRAATWMQQVKQQQEEVTEQKQMKQTVTLESPTVNESATSSSMLTSSSLPLITIYHPSNHAFTSVTTSLLTFCRSRDIYHHRLLCISALFLPITSLASILPGPNVFLAWNAWRVWSHWHARAGARGLIECIEKTEKKDTTKASSSVEIASVTYDESRSFEKVLDDFALYEKVGKLHER